MILSPQTFYIFHQIHLKLCRLPSYGMKMCSCFKSFDSTIFDGVIAHADIRFVGQKSCLLNSFYIFHRIHLKFCRLPSYIGTVILIIEELFPFFTR